MWTASLILAKACRETESWFAPFNSHRWQSSGGGVCLYRIVANDDGVDDREDLISRHADAPRVLADRFRISRLVNAERSELSVSLLDYIAADPADPVGHLFVADLGRFGASGFEFSQVRPCARAANDIEIHDVWSYLGGDRDGRFPKLHGSGREWLGVRDA